jgi:hypothetical protein
LNRVSIHLVAKNRDNLKSLRGICIDCGWRDQYPIHYGESRQGAGPEISVL